MDADGGERTVKLATEDFCSWVVAPAESWITLASASNGKGNVDIILRVARNDGPKRTSAVEVGGKTIAVRQMEAPPPPAAPSAPKPPAPKPPPAPRPPAPTPEPPPTPTPEPPPPPVPCTFQVAPAAFNSVPFSRSVLQVDVTTQAGCEWTSTSNPSWVTLSGGTNRTGSGRVELTVAENAGGSRSATLVIAGESVRIDQQSRPPCAYAINPSSYNASAGGGGVSVAVTTAAGCEWAVTGNPSWVSASPTSSAGTANTTISVQSNTGAARTATFKIAGKDFVVKQASAPCTYSAGRDRREYGSRRTTREIGVLTQSHCPVSATEDASWIRILSAPTFGAGEIVLRIEENPDEDSRSAPLTITGENFSFVVTIVQRGDD
jgi:hypothetical protein